MIGCVPLLVRLHDSEVLDELGVATVPPPLEPGDLVVNEHGVWRAVDVVPLPAGSAIDAIARTTRAPVLTGARTCAMCGRSSEGLYAWHTVVDESLVGEGKWDEVRRIEVCSWACLRHAYMAEEPGEPSPEGWKGEGN